MNFTEQMNYQIFSSYQRLRVNVRNTEPVVATQSQIVDSKL